MLNSLSKEIKELFYNKRIWLGILTVLIIIIIGTYYNHGDSKESTNEVLKLGVINSDDSSYSDLLLSYFDSSETFSSLVKVDIGEREDILRKFQEGKYDIYLEIPKDFAKNMVKLEHSPIKLTINIKDTTKAILFQNILKSYEKYISAVEVNAVGLYDIMDQDGMSQKLIDDTNYTISINMIFTALGKEAFFSYKPLKTFPITRVKDYYLVSILIMVMMYAGLYVGFRILKEISQYTFLRIKTTKMSIYQFLLAKELVMILSLDLISVTALHIIFPVIPLIKDVMICTAISMFCVSFAGFLSAFFRTNQRYILVGNLLLFYFIIIGGGIIPLQFLPQDILNISKVTPNYYMFKGILYLSKRQNPVADRIILILILASVLMFLITDLLFGRRGEACEEA